ncbi:MAG: hypothetical protein GY906_40525 [bacterium]|nr:hypothetical protein [bacterium]
MKNALGVTFGVLLAMTGVATAGEEDSGATAGLPLTGQEAVDFLRVAEVVGEPENFDTLAITDPLRIHLSDGTRTLRAVFKDEDKLYPSFRYGDGREVERAKDSYKHEIAASELDLLMDLDLVPPCVERKMFSRTGSLCLWVEGARTEDERRKQGLEPPDPERFNNDMREARLFQQFIADLDFSNIRNLIVDDDFRVHKIDSSMAFYPDPGLIGELQPSTYSRRLLNALESLDRDEVNEKLKPWLLKTQSKGLWARRDKILKRAKNLVAEHGEDKVLY